VSARSPSSTRSPARVRVGIVGYGYWGPNLARNFAELDTAEVVAICDTREKELARAGMRHPRARCVTEFDGLLGDQDIDAVVIATPVATHRDLAVAALRAGKHVLVTKPLAATSTDADEIVAAAREAGRVLLVDHTFVYMGAVQKIRSLVGSGELGTLYYFDSVRVNLGLYQRDVSVLWDLAVHDLSIIASLIDERPRAVSCIASAHLDGHPPDMGYMTLLYDSKFVAHVHVNWLSPIKVRRTLIGGSRKMILFDDLDPVEKIKVYDRGVTPREPLVGSGEIPIVYRRTGDVWIPQFDMTEALRVEAQHFVDCILNGAAPRTDGRSAADIVRILEAAERSAAEAGRAVPVALG
jgi:predicted dehydrogenase